MKTFFIDRIIPFLLVFVISVFSAFFEIYFIGFSIIVTLIIRITTLVIDWFLLSKPYTLIRFKSKKYFDFRFSDKPLLASYFGYTLGLSVLSISYFFRLVILYFFGMIAISNMILGIISSLFFTFVFSWIVFRLTNYLKKKYKIISN